MQLATSPPVVPPKRITLESITRARLNRPAKHLLYSPEGCGKTTFGAEAPEPIFLPTEDGVDLFEVPKFPRPKRWEDVGECLDVLESDGQSFKTLVIDTIDWLEPLCEEFICRTKGGKETLGSFGYGKGFELLAIEWHGFLKRLDLLRDRSGLQVILLAHSQVKRFSNPEGDDFDRYQLKLREKTSALTREWVDCVLFANYDILTDDASGRAKGVDGTARFIHTQRTAAYDAKNRFGLPPRIPLRWSEFEAAMMAGTPGSTEKLTAAILGLMHRLDEKTRGEVSSAIERAAGDALKLSKLLDWARGKIEINK